MDTPEKHFLDSINENITNNSILSRVINKYQENIQLFTCLKS